MFVKRVNAAIKRIAERLEKYVPFILKLIIVLYIGAQIIFSASRFGFDKNKVLTIAYFLCQDSSGAGCFVWLLIYLTAKPYRGLVFPVLINSIFVFLWDIISYPTGWGVNHPIATGIIFGLAALIVLYFIIKDFVCRLKHL